MGELVHEQYSQEEVGAPYTPLEDGVEWGDLWGLCKVRT